VVEGQRRGAVPAGRSRPAVVARLAGRWHPLGVAADRAAGAVRADRRPGGRPQPGPAGVRVGRVDVRVGRVDVRVGRVDVRAGRVRPQLGRVDVRVVRVDVRAGPVAYRPPPHPVRLRRRAMTPGPRPVRRLASREAPPRST
jgi:hypothetical protein